MRFYAANFAAGIASAVLTLLTVASAAAPASAIGTSAVSPQPIVARSVLF